MGIPYFQEVSVSGTASTRVVEEALFSKEGREIKVKSVIISEVTGTPQKNADIIFELNNTTIGQFNIRHFLNLANDEYRAIPVKLDLGFDMESGDIFKVGTVSGGTASDFKFLIEYEYIKD